MSKPILSLISNPRNWTQGCLARRKDGTPVESLNALFTVNSQTGEYEEHDFGHDAQSFSLYGAVARCYDIDRREFVLDKLRSAIRVMTGKNDYVAVFNDHPQTTHRDVLRVIQIANV